MADFWPSRHVTRARPTGWPGERKLREGREGLGGLGVGEKGRGVQGVGKISLNSSHTNQSCHSSG